MKKLLIVILLLVSGSVVKAAEKPVLNNAQIALVNDAQDYLAKVRTVSANFVQINPSTSIVSSGKIIIAKPGKLKMSYSEPYHIDYYINDDDLIQYDHDLDEVTRGSAPDNPLKVLLYDDITLAKNELMNVTNVTDEGRTFTIFMTNNAASIRDFNGLVLKFKKLPIELFSIGRVDYEGNNTQTNLSAISINQGIDDAEFMFKKPKTAFPGQKR